MSIFLSIIILVAIIGASLLGLLLVRRSVSIATLETHHDVAGFIYAVVGVLYAVLIAFVVLVVWEQFNKAEERIEHEAISLASIYRNTQGLENTEVKDKVEKMVLDYAETMIKYEFPAMERNSRSIENHRAYDNLWNYLATIKPESDADDFWFEYIVDAMNELQQSRRLRLLSVDYSVPAYMWFVLIFGAAITISFAYLFGTKKALPHVLMIISLSGVIGLVLLLVSSLEHPFSGIIHIGPESIKQLIETMK